MITVKSFLLLNLEPSDSASSMTAWGVSTKPIKIQVINAMIGIRMLLLTKSHASRIDIPSGCIKSHTPNPREEGIPIRRQ